MRKTVYVILTLIFAFALIFSGYKLCREYSEQQESIDTVILWSDIIRQRVNDFAAISKNNVIKNIFTALYNTARPAVMSDGLLLLV